MNKSNIYIKEQIVTTKLIGKVGVDSGTIWIGDPCYILSVFMKDQKHSVKIGVN